MAFLDIIKKNEIALTLEDYTFLILGEPKSGKTSLYANLVKEFYGDSSKGLLIPFEKGYRAIDGIQVFPHTIQTNTIIDGEEFNGWTVFTELVDELVMTKNENGIKVLCIDTIDEFFNVATNEILRRSFLKDKKKVFSLNEAFGGFVRGYDELGRMVSEQIEKLKSAGYGLIFIGHTKYKTIKIKADNVEYNTLGSNLQERLFAMIANSVDMIAMITIEKEIKKGVVTGETRKIRFRGDSFYVAGSRFENLPTTIDYGAAEFKEAYIKAIRENSEKSDEHFQEHLETQEAEKTEQANAFIASEQRRKEYRANVIEALKAKTKADPKSGTKLVKLVEEHGISLKKPNAIPEEVIDLLVSELELEV